MSGLAKIMKIKGYDVLGADLSRSYVTEELESIGITVFNNHDEKNMIDVDTVIASSAIKVDNPEYAYALKNGIKIIKRGELLGKLLNLETGIAVAGTHGKTTTSSMLSATMITKDPTIVVGGILPEIGSNARPGKSKYFIAEADESDNSFLYMKPAYSIITNIEEDHLENHGTLENIKASFSKFMNQTKKEVIVSIDCKNVVNIIRENEFFLDCEEKKIIKYSLKDKTADIYGEITSIKEGKTIYNVYISGVNIGEFSLGIPGEHNISNSLPVIYLSNKFGVEIEEIKRALLKFKGAKRRYDILMDEKIRVIDDYAHHPTEIKATLQGAKSIEKNRITAIFQPHRYSRINFLLDNFKGCFEDAERVILLPIYAAGEKNIYNITLEQLKDKIGHKNLQIMQEKNDILNLISSSEENNTFIFMGAGDISKLAHEITEKLRGR